MKGAVRRRPAFPRLGWAGLPGADVNTRKTGFKVSLLAFRRRRLWTYSKVGKVLVGGGSLSPESWVTASVPNSDSRSITRDALGLEVVMATKLSGILRKAEA